VVVAGPASAVLEPLAQGDEERNRLAAQHAESRSP
jgi:hypothetical protein